VVFELVTEDEPQPAVASAPAATSTRMRAFERLMRWTFSPIKC
jgi:hypothetical protein